MRLVHSMNPNFPRPILLLSNCFFRFQGEIYYLEKHYNMNREKWVQSITIPPTTIYEDVEWKIFLVKEGEVTDKHRITSLGMINTMHPFFPVNIGTFPDETVSTRCVYRFLIKLHTISAEYSTRTEGYEYSLFHEGLMSIPPTRSEMTYYAMSTPDVSVISHEYGIELSPEEKIMTRTMMLCHANLAHELTVESKQFESRLWKPGNVRAVHDMTSDDGCTRYVCLSTGQVYQYDLEV